MDSTSFGISTIFGKVPDHGPGSGSALNPVILACAGISAGLATIIASTSIALQLKNYRKPILQRQVVRIMLMIPIYAISSFVSLFSLEAAVVIDAIRDIYEAFVIYNFFHLLLGYLGGERSLLILLHGRPPKQHLFPVNLVKRDIDASDPFTFLFLKRGILQYVQVKPILAAVTLILKAVGKYGEGDFRSDKGYLYVAIVYNVSICISLYCLGMFWIVINDDVKPFRPMPKFLCIKGILFFCFWQGIAISVMVKAGIITHVGPYTDSEHISLAISDTLICFEMPLFAIAHLFAFSHTDYIDRNVQYAARMPFYYAVRDSFGLLDVLEDSRATFRGGVSYKTFEPVEGGMHVGAGRDRRIRAGLRYAKGGKQKYWLPMPTNEDRVTTISAPIQAARERWDQHRGYAPLLAEQADEIVHEGPSFNNWEHDPFLPDYVADDDDNISLDFGEPNEDEDALYGESRKLLFGDYNYPTIDVSTEAARMQMWDEEERILRDEQQAAFGWKKGGTLSKGYGATDNVLNKPTARREFHPAIIDFENENVPDLEVGGVRLKWSKGTAVPKAPAPQRSSSKTSTPSTSGSASRSSPRKPGGGLAHRSSSNLIQDPQPEHVSDEDDKGEDGNTAMPDDAVDLVVEDPDAAAVEMEQERRKGEPAMDTGTGLKKVYRRKYGGVDEKGKRKELEVMEEREVPLSPGELPDKTKVKVKSPQDEYLQRSGSGTESPWLNAREQQEFFSPSKQDVTEVTIARAATPPAHARVEINKYGMISDESVDKNPWA